MSGIPVIGKVFDKIKKNKILSAIVVAAVVYFTVSAATSYFSTAGAEAAAGSQLGGSVFTDTAAAAAAETQALGMSTVGFDVGATVGADATMVASTATAAPTVAGGTVAGSTGASGIVGTQAAAPAAGSWFAENPMATMVLGQGAMGAAGSYEQAKAEEAALAQREQERKDRGLFGFDYEGKPAGVISSAMQQPVAPQQVQAAQAPIVAGQQITAPGAMPQQIPIQRKDLPKLNQSGQIALG